MKHAELIEADYPVLDPTDPDMLQAIEAYP
jgi:hypothetical protein